MTPLFIQGVPDALRWFAVALPVSVLLVLAGVVCFRGLYVRQLLSKGAEPRQAERLATRATKVLAIGLMVMLSVAAAVVLRRLLG